LNLCCRDLTLAKWEETIRRYAADIGQTALQGLLQ
jgi:hypothetical protein